MKIAITGTFGSGKSSVSQIIRDNGYNVLDSDAICKSYYEKDSILYPQLRKILLPYDCIDDKGININKLKEIFFLDKKLKENITNLMYQQLSLLIVNNKDNIFIMEVPLLFESGFNKYFDYILCVYSDIDIVLDRLNNNRGYNKQQYQQRMNYQYDNEYKIKHSNYIIENNDDIITLEKKVKQWIQETLI